MRPLPHPPARIRRLVQRSSGFFYRCPSDEVIRFAGATKQEADAFIAARTVVIEAVVRKQRAFGKRAPYRKCYDGAVSRVQRSNWSNKTVMAVEEFDQIIARADGRCEVTGILFTWVKADDCRSNPWGPSLDRIDCSRAYELDNCRLVCTAVNIALSDFGEEVLTKIAKSLIKRQRLRGG